MAYISACCPTSNNSSGVVLGGKSIVTVGGSVYSAFMGFWDLDEVGGLGYTFLDSTTNARHGKGGDGVNSDLIPQKDSIGTACQPSQSFDGRQFITLLQPSISTTQSLTISCWAAVESFYKSRTLFSLGSFRMGFDFTNALCASVIVKNSDLSQEENTAVATEGFEQNVFYHFAATWLPGNGIKLYQNGELIGEKEIEQTELAAFSEAFIGGDFNESHPQCHIQDVRLSGERSEVWLKAEFDNICNYSDFVS